MCQEIEKRLRFALSLFPALRKISLSYYQKKIKVELKDNLSEVSLADKKCELFLRKKIKEKFPRDGIIGEEFPAKNSQGEYTWTLDPIDGTFSYVRGNPFFGSMLGLIHQDQAVMGLIDYPALKQTMYASKGQGAFYKGQNDRLFRKSDLKKKATILSQALFCHTGSEIWRQFKKEEKLKKLLQETKYERTWGDCYGYYLLVSGQCELMADAKLAIWDLIPIQIICREAGAEFFSLEGEDSIKIDSSIAFLPQFKKEISLLLDWPNKK
jgi:histidinol-phosphatase